MENRKTFAKAAGVKPEDIKLYCVEAVTRLLPMFDEKLSDYGIKISLSGRKLPDW